MTLSHTLKSVLARLPWAKYNYMKYIETSPTPLTPIVQNSIVPSEEFIESMMARRNSQRPQGVVNQIDINNTTEEQEIIRAQIEAQEIVSLDGEMSEVADDYLETVEGMATALREAGQIITPILNPLLEVFQEAVNPLMDLMNALGEYRNIPTSYLVNVNPEQRFIFAGGIHNDDDVSAQGDFLYTISRGIIKLRSEGFDVEHFNIYSNIGIFEQTDSINHTYRYVGISEYERIIARQEIREWIIDNELPDIILIKPIVEGYRQLPNALVITGLLTYEAPQYFRARWIESESRIGIDRGGVVPVRDGIIQEGSRTGELVDGEGIDMGAPVGVTVINGEDVISVVKMEFRDCWFCGNKMNFKECCEATPHMTEDHVKKIWKSKKVEIACCNCTEKLRVINRAKNGISEIMVRREHLQTYNLEKDCFLNKNKITSVVIRFKAGESQKSSLTLSKRQFQALLDKQIIDVPIELEEYIPEDEVVKEDRCTSDCAVER